MMGMVSTKLISIQESYVRVHGLHQLPEKWVTDLMTQLLQQVTHAQWIHRCILVHDGKSGMLVCHHKTELLEEITKQISLGTDNLMEDNKKYLLKGSITDLATPNG